MPLLEDSVSGTNHSLKIVEVLDVSDGEAMSFLTCKEVRDDVAKRL